MAGQASSILPSSIYCCATRCCASTILFIPSTNIVQVLDFGLQDLFGENGARVVEDLAEEAVNKPVCDPVAQAAGEHGFALVLKILQRFQITVFNQVRRITFFCGQYAPIFPESAD